MKHSRYPSRFVSNETFGLPYAGFVSNETFRAALQGLFVSNETSRVSYRGFVSDETFPLSKPLLFQMKHPGCLTGAFCFK
jgi:hypothetical protein